MVFYNDSFVKAGFFAKIMSKWDAPVFYFDFDLLYSGYVTAEEIPLPKNLTILSPDSDNLFEETLSDLGLNEKREILMKNSIIKISKDKKIFHIENTSLCYFNNI